MMRIWRDRAKSWLREPLVHFLLAGAVVFALLSGRAPDPGERRIVVNEAVVARLVDRWTMTYRRAPNQDEIDGLIRDYVRDQVYYREALRLGLDRDDEVVVRRMRLKLTSVATAEAESEVPSDADLQVLLDKNPARYAAEPQLTFRQVYLGQDNPQNRQIAAAAIAAGNPGAYAQPAPIPARFERQAASEVAEQFGDEFVPELRKSPPGKWAGPVPSGLGIHLVLLEKLDAPPPPRLADVRQQLTNDWRVARVSAAEDANYRDLLEGYDVVIEKPR